MLMFICKWKCYSERPLWPANMTHGHISQRKERKNVQAVCASWKQIFVYKIAETNKKYVPFFVYLHVDTILVLSRAQHSKVATFIAKQSEIIFACSSCENRLKFVKPIERSFNTLKCDLMDFWKLDLFNTCSLISFRFAFHILSLSSVAILCGIAYMLLYKTLKVATQSWDCGSVCQWRDGCMSRHAFDAILIRDVFMS